MLLTEEQARAKVCCGPLAIVGQMEGAPLSRCDAADCMAWRWEAQQKGNNTYMSRVNSPPNERGYCGLAGRPEVA